MASGICFVAGVYLPELFHFFWMNLSGGCYPALLVEVFACCHTELVEVASLP